MIGEKISNTIREFKTNNENIETITLGHNQLMDLKKLVNFDMPTKYGYVGSIHGVKIIYKNEDDYFEINEEQL